MLKENRGGVDLEKWGVGTAELAGLEGGKIMFGMYCIKEELKTTAREKEQEAYRGGTTRTKPDFSTMQILKAKELNIHASGSKRPQMLA